MSRLALLASMLLVTAPACSFVATSNPPPGPPTSRPDCSTSKASPFLDIVGGLVFPMVLVGFAAAGASDNGPVELGASAVLLPYALIGTPFVVSAITGFGRVDRCRDAVQAWNDSVALERLEPRRTCVKLTTVGGEHHTSCHRDAADCEAVRADALAHPDEYTTASACAAR